MVSFRAAIVSNARLICSVADGVSVVVIVTATSR
jgi:hypothetical protein